MKRCWKLTPLVVKLNTTYNQAKKIYQKWMKNLSLSWQTMISPVLGAQAGKMSLGWHNVLGAFEFILGHKKTLGNHDICIQSYFYCPVYIHSNFSCPTSVGPIQISLVHSRDISLLCWRQSVLNTKVPSTHHKSKELPVFPLTLIQEEWWVTSN